MPVGGIAEPVVLGEIEPLGYRFGTDLGAAQAVAEVNAAGGVLGGRPLRIELRDDRADPTVAVAQLRELVASGVRAIVGSSYSNSGLAVLDDVERAGVPYLSAGAADAQVNPVRPYVFMTPPTAGVVAEQLLRYLQANGLTRLAVAHDSTSMFSRTGLAEQEAMAAGYGVEFVTRQVFSTETTDFDDLLAAVAASGAHALMVWATGPPPVAITGPFEHAGLGIPLVMSHGAATHDYLTGAGAAAEGVLVATSLAVAGPALPDSPVRDAVLRMAGPFTETHGRYPSQFAFDGYGAVHLIAAAIDRAGSDEPRLIQRELTRLTLLTPEGRYRYTPTDHAGLTVDDVAVTVVRDGAFALTDWSRTQLEHTLVASG
jgi:branched-chain amino acid transport system substrate-binding protein